MKRTRSTRNDRTNVTTKRVATATSRVAVADRDDKLDNGDDEKEEEENDRNENDASLDDEYDTIRTIGYETVTRYIDTTLQRILHDTCQTMMTEIQQFIFSSSSSTSSTSSIPVVSEIESVSLPSLSPPSSSLLSTTTPTNASCSFDNQTAVVTSASVSASSVAAVTATAATISGGGGVNTADSNTDERTTTTTTTTTTTNATKLFNAMKQQFTIGQRQIPNNHNCNTTTRSSNTDDNISNNNCSSSYSPLLLPLVMIDGPLFAIQDRQLLLSHIYNTLQHSQSQPPPAVLQSQSFTLKQTPPPPPQQRPCCVWLSLPSSVSTTTTTTSRRKSIPSLQEQLVHQCWWQEFHKIVSTSTSSSTTDATSNNNTKNRMTFQQYMKLQASTTRRRHHGGSSLSSCTDQLVAWASQTRYFDTIGIFLSMEHGNLLYNHHCNSSTTNVISFESFLHWCTERRHRDGVPMSIIMHNPNTNSTGTVSNYRKPIPYSSLLLQGDLIRVRHITRSIVPSTKTILRKFLHCVYRNAITTKNPSAMLVLVELYRSCCHRKRRGHFNSSTSTTTTTPIMNPIYQKDFGIVRTMQSIQQQIIMNYFILTIPSSPTTTLSINHFMHTIAIVLHGDDDKNTNGRATTTSLLLSKQITSFFYDGQYWTKRNALSLESSNNKQNSNSISSCSEQLFRQLEDHVVDQYMSSIALQLLHFVRKKHYCYTRNENKNDADHDRNRNTNNNHTHLEETNDEYNQNNEDVDDKDSSVWVSLFFGGGTTTTSSNDDGSNKFSMINDRWENDSNKILNDNDRRSLILCIVTLVQNGKMAEQSVFSMLDIFVEEQQQHISNVQDRIDYAVNQLIVLLDHCVTLTDVQGCIDSLLLVNRDDDTPSRYCTGSGDIFTSRIPCPRRDYVRAMIQTVDSIYDEDKEANASLLLLINVPGIMYRLIQDRVSITELEWYNAFMNHLQNNEYDIEMQIITTKDWFPIFGCGIRHLQISGLIRRVEGKKNSIQYERTALVWCGGD